MRQQEGHGCCFGGERIRSAPAIPVTGHEKKNGKRDGRDQERMFGGTSLTSIFSIPAIVAWILRGDTRALRREIRSTEQERNPMASPDAYRCEKLFCMVFLARRRRNASKRERAEHLRKKKERERRSRTRNDG